MKFPELRNKTCEILFKILKNAMEKVPEELKSQLKSAAPHLVHFAIGKREMRVSMRVRERFNGSNSDSKFRRFGALS